MRLSVDLTYMHVEQKNQRFLCPTGFLRSLIRFNPSQKDVSLGPLEGPPGRIVPLCLVCLIIRVCRYSTTRGPCVSPRLMIMESFRLLNPKP